MAYYNTIRNPGDFLKAALSQQAVSFMALQQSESWESAASQWGIQYLFACRVICKQPSDILPLLADRIYPGCETGIHHCIDNLIQGPRGEPATLRQMAELQIVRTYKPESLGYVWAALAHLLQPDSHIRQTMTSERPVRARNRSDHGEYISTEGFQISSSPLERPNTASSLPSSVGYMERSSAPLVEDYTVRFLSCLIRCVLNYAQPVDKKLPFIEYRDGRLTYREPGVGKPFEAVDDGGVQLMHPSENFQVAILEAKRSFQDISDGSPTVSNELLAQIAGEALALRLSSDANCISAENIISIVAVKYYIKIFHFNITDDFVYHFKTLLPTDESPDMSTYLKVDSTVWFDMRELTGRKYFVRHLLALVAWADTITNSEDSEDSMDMEE
ncbi:hypothetical protein AJ80_10032 [Polytolypa hystricis UAMH7299]|uniref:Uncharacterized protein n=1 Tax=Polytolypa hystricis (strain UAMH7299) TaxID=1447883 RepID=A0A2B7W6B7_POLH7|nr:hypothetical protein AJ80_10032 [Polytolypa hystricis UAMH7299]